MPTPERSLPLPLHPCPAAHHRLLLQLYKKLKLALVETSELSRVDEQYWAGLPRDEKLKEIMDGTLSRLSEAVIREQLLLEV
jgi:hypothetical protein